MRFKKHKYSARKTVIDGITFDSKAEARYYQELKLREHVGELEILELQPKVYLTRARILFKPDFKIKENGVEVWIDRKGMDTPVFKLKRGLWKVYGPGILRVVYDRKIVEVVPERRNYHV